MPPARTHGATSDATSTSEKLFSDRFAARCPNNRATSTLSSLSWSDEDQAQTRASPSLIPVSRTPTSSLGTTSTRPSTRVSSSRVTDKKGSQGITRVLAKPKPVSICGRSLQPTVVFDTFWRFAAERKAIDDRRRAGQAEPWTDDAILQKFPFCNTYRVLDRVCQYIIREVIEKGSQTPEEIVFRVTLFNTFTKIETWELLREELGPLTWAKYDRKKYQTTLSRAKNSGMTLYTGSFQKPAPSFGAADAFVNHLCLLEVLMENKLHDIIMCAEHMADIFEWLVSFPSMGEFSTYQLMLNLSYTKLMNFSNFDFVVPGPGATSGLTKMFGKSIQAAKQRIPGFEIEVIRWMADTQGDHFERLGLNFSGLGPKRLPMDLADIEHTLCEVDKYSRIAHPHFKGKSTHIRRTFKASNAPYPSVPTLPKAWTHPRRKVVRIRPGDPWVIEKRYTVQSISAHRQTSDGLEFLVYWAGYPDSDATWEPKLTLAMDAPTIVQEYMASKGIPKSR